MRRPLAVTALLAPALVASAAAAAPRTYCRVLTDATDDASTPQNAVTPDADGDVEIVSGDVATSATHLTAVLRVADLTPDDPAGGVQGRRWVFAFSGDPSHHYSLVATLGGAGAGYALWREARTFAESTPEYPPAEVGRATGAVDTVRNEIRITVPLAAFRPTGLMLRKGMTLSGFGAYSTRSVGDFQGSPMPSRYDFGNGNAYWFVHPGNAWDDASTPDAAYPVGARSCVAVG